MPFTTDQFFELFLSYNLMTRALLVVFYLASFGALWFIASRHRLGGTFALSLLSAFWIWMGVGYHWLFFTAINSAAYVFGAVFVFQGIVFAFAAQKKWLITSELRSGVTSVLGAVLIVYALVLYPLIGLMVGHGYPNGPILGLPCPTTLLTVGVIALFEANWKRLVVLYSIPVLWGFVATFAAVNMKVVEDYALIASSVFAIVLTIIQASSEASSKAKAKETRYLGAVSK